MLEEMKKYARYNWIPVILDDSLELIKIILNVKKPKKILEIGTAIGYSAIMMAYTKEDIHITSIERDEQRYLEALRNVKRLELEDKITLIFNDAFNVSFDDKFDLIFIDAAKAQNIKFFEKFEYNLKSGGYIITDNLNFHGLVSMDVKDIKSRNLRQLVRKINDYKRFLEKNSRYVTRFIDVGDGISVSRKST